MSRFVFEERPYQTEAVAPVLTEFENGRESVLLESPVGSGKTVMGLMIIQKLQENSNGQLRVNWVASRRHILEQTQDLNDSFFHCQVNMVSVFASNPPKADLVILDDKLARKTARYMDLTITGTMGVLIKAKKEGYIQAVKPLIDKLIRNGLIMQEIKNLCSLV